MLMLLNTVCRSTRMFQENFRPFVSLTFYCFRFDCFHINLQITLFVQFAQASLWISLVVSHTS